MKRFAWMVLVVLAMVLWLAPPVRAQAVTSVLVKASVPTMKIKVDGREYIGSAAFLWPVGSKHFLDVFVRDDGFQYNDVNTSRSAFSGWTDNTGQLQTGAATAIVITADPRISVLTANFSIEHMVQFVWYDGQAAFPGGPTSVSPSNCASPGNPVPLQFRVGVVYINGTCYWNNVQLWMPEGTHSLNAFPYPGFVFLGWKANENPSESFVRSFTVRGPLTVSPRFTSAKRVNFRTEPLGLRIRVDRADINTTDLEPCTPNNFVAPGAPLTIAPLCTGEFDFLPGSTHQIGAPPWQTDRTGKNWVFTGWDNGLGQDATYQVPVEVQPTVRITGNFVRGVSAAFTSKPSGLRISVDGQDTRSENFYVMAPGTKVKLSAVAEQTDARGRKYRFRRWSNGGPASQEVTVHDDVEKSFSVIAEYDLLAQAVVRSNPVGGTITVDGAPCTTPCTIDRPDGTEVRLAAPQTISVSDAHRLEFQNWSDSPSRERALKLAGSDSANIQANFKTAFRLSTALDPPEAGTLSVDPASPDGFYPADTFLTLTAQENNGFRFRRWDYDLGGTSRTTGLPMSSPRIVVARFDKVPFIAPAGIRNLAGDTPEGVVAPGSLVRISGALLAPYSETGPTGPILAQTLATVAVMVGDRILPLLSVSPDQIVAQLPRNLPPGENQLRVIRVGQPEVTGKFTAVSSALGLFSTKRDEQDFANAYHADGTEVNADKPARPGETISLLGTGLGRYTLNQPEGFAFPSSPPFPAMLPIEVSMGPVAAELVWAGGMPGQVGIDSVKIKLPAEFPEGTAKVLPLTVRSDGRNSNTVMVNIE